MIRRVFVEEEVKTYHTPFSTEDIQSAVQEARESERVRIVALLDEAFIYNEPVVIERDRLITLIKGEN
jgi:hypothetical protein